MPTISLHVILRVLRGDMTAVEILSAQVQQVLQTSCVPLEEKRDNSVNQGQIIRYFKFSDSIDIDQMRTTCRSMGWEIDIQSQIKARNSIAACHGWVDVLIFVCLEDRVVVRWKEQLATLTGRRKEGRRKSEQ